MSYAFAARRFGRAPLPAAIMLALGSAASGQVTVATDSQTGPGPFTPNYTVSATDLLNGATPSAQSGNFQEEASGGAAVLTNGSFGVISGGNPGNNAVFATAGAGERLTYALDLAASPGGYNLSGITTYGGWNDNGRDQQLYTVAYSTVANPSAFIDLTSVDFNPVAGTDPSATRVSITDVGGTLASGVAAIRFTFDQPAAPENGYTGYTEIDVFGAAVPEPTSLGLLGMAVMGFVTRRRRV